MTGNPCRFDDLFHSFGPVTVRRFFGGEAIYADAVMFATIFNDVIYFKTSIETRKPYLDEGCKPLAFRKKSDTVETGYFSIPDRLHDDPEELAQWAHVALSVARQKLRPRATPGRRATSGAPR